MTVQPEQESDSSSPAKIIKKFRKGDLVKVDRGKYLTSLESKSSDIDLPEYIFQGPGEVLLIRNEYCQLRWRRPVPDTWIQSHHLISYN